MTTLQIIVMTCAYSVALAAAVYFARATARRVVGALAGGGAAGCMGLGAIAVGEALGLLRVPLPSTPGPLALFYSSQGKNACQHLIAMLAVAACLTFPAHAVGQEPIDPMAATVAQRFTMIERSFVALADAMPAEKFAFKPTNGEFTNVRTFGEQVKHVACSNFAFFNEIEKKEPPDGCGTGGPHPATTKAELMTYLRESFAYAGRVLRTMTPANALEPAGGPYGGMSTRLGLTTLAVWHASDHYGQLVVYLRMNRIVPPAGRPVPVEPTSASVATVFKDGGAYGTVTRVDLPFGNLDTSFVESDVRSIGIASGDSFQVRCRDKALDIFLGSNFGDVPRGEWVALFSLQGTLKIARNFASAAEASGCKAGDSLFVSKRPRVK